MAVKDKSSAKQVRDIKGEDAPKKTIEINPGNVSILTVRLLDQLVTEMQGLRQDIRELKDG
jgi:hypothetical protein